MEGSLSGVLQNLQALKTKRQVSVEREAVVIDDSDKKKEDPRGDGKGHAPPFRGAHATAGVR